ncbi:hypothetical protein LUX05_10755 [Streptomyces somaliensis]|nr:hypothetical protein [Streptomyces somaliensis]
MAPHCPHRGTPAPEGGPLLHGLRPGTTGSRRASRRPRGAASRRARRARRAAAAPALGRGAGGRVRRGRRGHHRDPDAAGRGSGAIREYTYREYTYGDEAGGTVHAVDRAYVAEDGTEYAVHLTARERDRPGARRAFDVALSTRTLDVAD